MCLQLYAYPATVNLSEVSDYPHNVGNSQFFCRIQCLWGLQSYEGSFGISVKGHCEIIVILCGQECCRHMVDEVVE